MDPFAQRGQQPRGDWNAPDDSQAYREWEARARLQANAPVNTRAYSLRGLATALTVLFVIVAFVNVGSARAMFHRAGVFDQVRTGGFVDQQTADVADGVIALFLLIQILFGLAIAVLLIIWQFRHAKNAQFLGSRRALGPGWAIGGWFVPVAALALPGMQIYGASRFSDISSRRGPAAAGGRGARIVVAWWLTFLAAGGCYALARTAYSDPRVITDAWLRQMAAADQFTGTGDVLYAAASVLAIVMVRRLTTRQEAALQAQLGISGSGWAANPLPGSPAPTAQPSVNTPPAEPRLPGAPEAPSPPPPPR